MRAAPLLAMFAFVDVLLVAITGADEGAGIAARELRAQLLGILVVCGAGVVALAGLGLAARRLHRRPHGGWRAAGAFAIGLVHGGAFVGFLGWTGLWFSPVHAPVAVAGLACAVGVAWQALASPANAGEVRESVRP